MKTKAMYLFLFLVSFQFGFSQMSGNSVYGENRNNYTTNYDNGFSISDNSLTIKVKILMNKKADRFMITLGLNEEANSVENCMTQINQRIDGFTEKLSKFGIKKDDYYVDFIAQTKVYDYNVSNTKAEQIEKGFEIKKNIIIKSTQLKTIEAIINLASQFKIYDIIKVDYIADDSENVYTNLFGEALKIGESKKERYSKAFGKRIIGTPTATDQFSMITPESQYKNYKAFESSELESYYNSSNAVLKKIARKNSTFYYDGVSQAGFDKIINNATPEVGLQYVLTLTITYKIDTSN